MRKREKNYPHIAALNVHEQSHRGRREKEVSTPLGFTTPCTSGAKKTRQVSLSRRVLSFSARYTQRVSIVAQRAQRKRG